jgi:hypothetical protein
MDGLEERQVLDQVLDAARRGLSAALVVRGEPGVGKTSLLGYVVDSAAGFRVVHLAGVESELELGFAGCTGCWSRSRPRWPGCRCASVRHSAPPSA